MDWSRRLALARVITWAAAIPVAWYMGWIYSVAFVALCSLYANWASDYAAWRSDTNPQAEQIDRIEKKVDALLRNREEPP